MEYNVTIVNVYHQANIESSFNLHVEKKGKLTIYRIAYRSSGLKYVASAKCVWKAMAKAEKETGKITQVFLNVFYPLGAHLWWIKRKLKAPIYALEHWTGYHTTNPHFRKDSRHLKIAQLASKNCKKVIAVSKDLSRSMVQQGLQNVSGVVYNVVDNNLFCVSNKAPGSKPFTWLHISSLKDEHKNFSLLLKSFAVSSQSGDSKLVVVNSGKVDPYLELIEELNIADKVIFKGSQTMTAIAEVMQSCHAFVLSSNYENMPCVVAEALCCGLPVVATDVGGISEVINSTNGILVPSGNAIALTKALEKMQTEITSYDRAKIGKGAKSEFGQQAVLNQFKEALEL